jgi:hypothetical protein
VVATAAVLFGVVFGILFLACEQREDEPDARANAPASAEAPASAKAKPDSPPAPAASQVAADNKRRFNDERKFVQDLGLKIEALRGKATGDLEVAFGELEAEQAQLMAELDAIGGDNEKWDAASTELHRKAWGLRSRVRDFGTSVNE